MTTQATTGDNELIKTNPISVQGNINQSTHQASISPPIRSVHSKSIGCQEHTNKTVPDSGSTDTLGQM